MRVLDKVQPYARKAFVRVKPGLQRLHSQAETFADKRVSFLTGFPRSGTNMVIDVFEWSSQTKVFREADPRANDNFQLRDDMVIQDLVLENPAHFVMVKALLDGHRVGQLMQLFPDSCAVWMYRHYDDCVNSILVRWPGHRNGIDEIVREGPQAAGWRGGCMSDETLGLLCRQYSPAWNDATANAWFWYLRHQLFFDQGFDTDPRAMLVRYESLVVDPLRVIQPIADLVGVTLTPVMASVPHARSVRKQTAPDIEPEVRALCDDMLARLDTIWDRSPAAKADA